MSGAQTMIRTGLRIDGRDHLLAQGQDLDELRSRIEAAASGDARFVDFVVVGNRNVSVLVTRATQVVLTTETVQYDERDTGDEKHPFGGLFDL